MVRNIRFTGPSPEKNYFLILFILLWAYIWLRGIFTQLTHDEIATFYRYVQISRFLPFKSEWSANNHILNSFLTWVFYSLLGPHTIVFRLANILSFPLFFYYLVKIAGWMDKRFLRLAFVTVICLTHNFIEFFAISRGYGISMAFLVMGLYYLVKAFNKPSAKNILIVFLSMFMALTANLTLLNTAIIISLLLLARLFTYISEISRGKFYKYLTIIIIFGILPIIFYTIFLLGLQTKGELYYGETWGFWVVTVRTLLWTMLESKFLIFEAFTGIYLALLFIFGAFFIFKHFKPEVLFNKYLLFFILLFVNIIAYFLLRHLFGVNYPEDRTGLFFIIYFIGNIFFFTDLIARDIQKRAIYAVIPLFYIPLHFFWNVNLSHNSFENCKIPERFYNQVLEDHVPGNYPPTMGGRKGRELRWAFLNYKHGGVLGKIHGSLYPNIIEDYQIVDIREYPEWMDHYDSIDYHPQSNYHLLKRKNKPDKKLIFSRGNIKTDEEFSGEYLDLADINVDTLQNDTLYIGFDLNFNTGVKPFKSWLAVSVRNRNDEEIRYEYFALDWLKYDWSGENGKIINGMIVPLPETSERMIFYVWNAQKIPFEITDGRVNCYKYTGKQH